MNAAPIVAVAAAVLQRADGQVLLAQRLEGTPYPGYWEFPGGKLEAGESPRAALDRELHEELGIEVLHAAPWLTRRYDYAHARVELRFFRVLRWRGEPLGRDGQALSWQVPGSFDVAPLLPANTAILRALELPLVYGVSMAEQLGEDAFLERAQRAIEAGLRLIQLREKSWPEQRLAEFARRLVPLAHAHGARVLLNGEETLAAGLGCDGVHWTAARLLRSTARPEGMLCAASCHDARELAQAAALELDFAVLGPVAATPTHPWASPLGWDGVASMLRDTPIPVYALGGLGRGGIAVAIDRGAQGVALRRAAWEA